MKVTLKQFYWNYDVTRAKTAGTMISAMEEFGAIEKLSLVGAINSKSTRGENREKFNEITQEGAILLLTEKEMQKDHGEEYDSDSSDSDADSDGDSSEGSGSD